MTSRTGCDILLEVTGKCPFYVEKCPMSADEPSAKAAVTVSEMAEMCMLSRSRWYDFIEAGIFPKPIPIPPMKRLAYDWQLQQKCLEIRATGIGLNGPVVFNRRRRPAKPAARRPAKDHPVDPAIEPIFDAVKALGLTTTLAAVSHAVAFLFSPGLAGQDQGDVIRSVFLHLQGRHT